MSQPGETHSSAGATNSGKTIFLQAKSANVSKPSESQPTKLRSLLPRSLLNPVPKVSEQPQQSITISDTQVKTPSFINGGAFQAGEIILSGQQNDDVRLQSNSDAVTVSSSQEALDALLRHLNSASANQVLALGDVPKFLSLSSDVGDDKAQVLHVVTLDDATKSLEGEQPVQLSLTPESQAFPVTTGLPAQDTDSQTPIMVMQASPGVHDVAVRQVVSPETGSLPLTKHQSPGSVHAMGVKHVVLSPDAEDPVVKRKSSNVEVPSKTRAEVTVEEGSETTDLCGASTDERGKEEVIKKTMVEAFVKMVVCRKVTVQKVNTVTGQVVDTKVQLEEEEPVILGVDCVETTEDLLSSSTGRGGTQADKQWGASLDGGLKFLSAVSESREKIGKNLLADALLKSSLRKNEAGRDTVWRSLVNASESGDAGTGVKTEAGAASDSEWLDDNCNDESEDYVPGAVRQSKTSGRQSGQGSRAAVSSASLLKAGDSEKKVAEPRTYSTKKRGRKRRWDNALGIASNLKTCQFCNKRFKDPDKCARHMKKGKCVSSLSCFLCGKPFADERQLELHLSSHEEKTRSGNFSCSDCNRTYRTRAGYLKHFRMGTCLKRDQFEDGEAGDFACDICSAQFTTAAYLKLHKYKVHENPADKHTCADCGKKFYSMQGYNKHRSGRPCTEPLTCKICGKTYSSKAKESYKIHMRQHRTEATGLMFECDECDRSYMTQMALNKHKLSHTGVKPYKCEICGKEFAMRYMVKDHARTHTGERPYPCSLCGSAFSNRGHLGRHMRSHENGTLLKRGRPKKVREEQRPLAGLKVVELSQALQQLDRGTIQVVDGQMLDSQLPGTPMIIRADSNTIIITEGWPAASGGAEGAGPVVGLEQVEEPGVQTGAEGSASAGDAGVTQGLSTVSVNS